MIKLKIKFIDKLIEMQSQNDINEIKSRNPIRIENSLDLDLWKVENDNSHKQLNILPQISPKYSNNLRSAKAFISKRRNRQEQLYNPYIKERDGIGKI